MLRFLPLRSRALATAVAGTATKRTLLTSSLAAAPRRTLNNHSAVWSAIHGPLLPSRAVKINMFAAQQGNLTLVSLSSSMCSSSRKPSVYYDHSVTTKAPAFSQGHFLSPLLASHAFARPQYAPCLSRRKPHPTRTLSSSSQESLL